MQKRLFTRQNTARVAVLWAAASAFSPAVYAAPPINMVAADTTPPVLQQILVVESNDVRLLFSEPVDVTTAQNPARFGTSGFVQAAGVSTNGRIVGLSIGPGPVTSLPLTISGIRDLAGNVMAPVVTNILLPDPTLELWFKLDEGKGGMAMDSSPHARHGLLSSTVTWTNGHTGTGLQFDKSATSPWGNVYLPSMTYGTQFSICFWFRCASNDGKVFQSIYSHGLATANSNVNIMITESSNTEPNRLRTVLLDADDSVKTAVSSLDVPLTGFPDNSWHFYVLTVKKGTGARVYLDGILRASNAALGGSPFTAANCFLGYYWSRPASRDFGGQLDDLRIHSRELDANEIAALKNLGPSASIASPTANTEVLSSEPILLKGSGADPEGSSLRYVWTDSTNGVIAEGATTTGRLTRAGTRKLTLVTFDAWGAHAESDRPLSVVADANTNGLPDAWEASYWPHGGCQSQSDDDDHDGHSNYQEWLAGTDPTNAASVLKWTHSVREGSRMTLDWTAQSGREYTILSSTNLGGIFTTATTVVATSDGPISYTNVVTANACFYRLEISSTAH